MIIVTGASGKLGHEVVVKLAHLVPPEQVGVSVRNPEKVADLHRLGVRVRRGDFEDPATLAHAFEGATKILLISSNTRSAGGDSLAQHRSAIDAARNAGASRILYTSHAAASLVSAFPPARDHAATERLLAESGVAWTALRHGFHADSAFTLIGDAPTSGVLEAPADGKVSWTTHADLAEVDARILAGEVEFDGPTPPLTASEALDLDDLADVYTRVLDTPVRRAIVSDEEFKDRMGARGVPAARAELVLGLYEASRAGEFARVDPTLERIIGRHPIAMSDVIARRATKDDGER